MKSETLYIAYGSNLNLPQMAFRCPTVRVVSTIKIKDCKLLFSGGPGSSVVTVEPLKGSSVPVPLWKLRGKTVPAMVYDERWTSLRSAVHLLAEHHPGGLPIGGL